MKEAFDYYIYLDYSERLIGYVIMESKNIPELLPKLIKFRHFKNEKHKRTYIIKIKREIRKLEIGRLILKEKIQQMKDNLPIFLEVIEFVKKYDNCKIFASIDNNQYHAFVRLLNMIPHKDHVKIVKESELKKDSVEYKLSLIIDTKLNIERLSK